MQHQQLLAACVEAAATLVAARGRVSMTDEATITLQVSELALNIFDAVERRAVSRRQSQFVKE